MGRRERELPGASRRRGGAAVGSPAAVVAAVATLVVLQPQAAFAAWAATGTGSAPTVAASVQRAAAPTATQLSSSSVRMDWPAVTLSEGTPATGYTVLRHTGSGVSTVCTTVAPIRSCTDTAPVQTAAQYGVVARYQSWTGQESSLTAFTLDQTPPTTALSSNPVPNGAGWNRSAVTLTLSASDPAGVASLTYLIGTAAPVTVAGSSTSFGVSAQGSTAVTYYATDTYGNVETTRSYTVKIDTTAPAAPTLTSISSDTGVAGDRITNVPAQTLSGVAEAGATVTISRGATTFPSVVAAANGAYSVPVTLAPGVNSFSAVAVDPAGNASPSSAPLAVTLDSVLPSATITDPRNGVTYKNGGQGTDIWASTCGGSPGACGTASDSGSGVASVTFELRDTTANTCWTGTGTTYATCGSPLGVTGLATWSRAIAFTVVNNHALRLTITVTDVAGNAGTSTVTFSG